MNIFKEGVGCQSNEKKVNSKVDKILLIGNLSKHISIYQNWYSPLKNLCNNLITFDLVKESLFYGKELMNKKLLDLVKKEKPTYIFFCSFGYLHLRTLSKIKEISLKTKTVIFFGDDDNQFESSSRYYALFFDYVIPAQPGFVNKYKKEGAKNVFYLPFVANAENFKFLNLEKKYDVTFIGYQKGNRADIIRYLKNKGIKIRIFGWFWDKCPDLKDIYFGIPNNQEMVKIINQTKINLSFTEGIGGMLHIKGRVAEVISCKSFMLTQYFSRYLDFFKNNKEIVMFKNKEDLLKKIKYYLKNEKEREKIAERGYKKMVDKYSINIKLKEFIEKTSNEAPIHKELPKLNKKIIVISEKEMKLSLERIKEKTKNYDYISFETKKCKILPFKNYLQAYSLVKSKKDISCCAYYVYSKNLDDYLLLFLYDAFEKLNKRELPLILNINQLMVTKEYFLKNFVNFERIFKGEDISFVNKKNTVLVNIPLIQIEKLKVKNYKILRGIFGMEFSHKLYSLFYQKKLFTNKYAYLLVLEILKGKLFILEDLVKGLNDKGRMRVVKDLKES